MCLTEEGAHAEHVSCSVAEQGRERREAASDPDNDRQPGSAPALLRLGLHRLHKDYAVRRQVRMRLSDHWFLGAYLRLSLRVYRCIRI